MCVFRVDLKEILNNFNKVKSILDKKTKICVVAKANAYGFGIKKICSLLKLKADYFAVARLSEFLKIKELDIKKPILILSPLLENDMKVAIAQGAEIEISNLFMLEMANKIASRKKTLAKVHLKLDTGMSRYGIKDAKELCVILDKLKCMKNVELIGCFSHLCYAENKDISEKQREKFIEFKNIVKKYGFDPIFHLANSCGLKDKRNEFDMVRLGFDLYNSKSSKHSFEANIVEIKTIKKEEGISYNHEFVANKDMKIAVCSAGYADGVPRTLSNKAKVLIGNKQCDVVGNVCMDAFMANISEVCHAKVGDRVIIFGSDKENSISVCEMAQICDTIPYEIYTRISDRVKRVYKWR